MATKYITLKGRLKWTKFYEPDSYSGSENWKCDFFPEDGAEWEKFQKTGLQLMVKDDPDGLMGKFIRFRRPTKKTIKDEVVFFSPPEITGQVNVSYVNAATGEKVRQYTKADGIKLERRGDPVNIGNGSLALVNLSYYDTVKGPGHRLENINVLELVEYQKAEDSNVNTPVKEDTTPKEKTPEDTKAALNDQLPW